MKFSAFTRAIPVLRVLQRMVGTLQVCYPFTFHVKEFIDSLVTFNPVMPKLV